MPSPSELISFLRGLRAVRDYTSQPIPEQVVQDILEVGRWSGSASNKQPVELIVVRDPAIKQKMTDGGVGAAAGSALSFVIVTPGDQERHDLEVFDDGRLAERLMLAARGHGLGSCIGTLKGEGPKTIKEALGIPADKRVWTVITVGYTDEEAHKNRSRNPTAGRKPTDEFVHWDRYA